MSFKQAFWLTIFILLMAMLMGGSNASSLDPLDRVQAFTRPIEFDYVSWTLDAMGIKLGQIALGTSGYLPEASKSDTVINTLELIRQINQVEGKINDIYADPSIDDPESASLEFRIQLMNLRDQRAKLEPVAEAVLQDQVGEIAAQLGLTLGGQVFPPVLYHTTPPPDALIISPRNEIRVIQNISISPDLTADQMDALENKVDQSLDVSSLVVGIGGIGLYPTMVMETTDINGLAEVVAHEWVHNYLSLHPLGFSYIGYLDNPQLRTMNETTAWIAGKELGRLVVEKYYPEYAPPPESPVPQNQSQDQPSSPPVFNFRVEMRLTRVTADRLLAEGKVDVAESYMELRRQYLWENGYHIRKLNQAYFAFYGAYEDQPGGAAGNDPVVSAVRSLRDKSTSLANFINRIAWMWNFKQLEKAVGGQ